MRLKVHRKDIYLEPGLNEELEERVPHMQVPVVFADGMLLGVRATCQVPCVVVFCFLYRETYK